MTTSSLRRRFAITVAFAALVACASTAFAYSDAEILALEISGELLPPAEMVAQLNVDLAAIREYEPYFATIHVLPGWQPGELVITLHMWAWQDFLNGEYHGLDALNAQYGPVQITAHFPPVLLLTFSQPYNSPLLAPIYAAAEGVMFAEPSGGSWDGDDITASALGAYTFKHGWGDCPSGCTLNHFWEFTVTNGVVNFVSDSGDDFGACCIFDGPCIMTTPEDCPGGFYGGLCDPNPCAVSTEPVRWGRVKAAYRSTAP